MYYKYLLLSNKLDSLKDLVRVNTRVRKDRNRVTFDYIFIVNDKYVFKRFVNSLPFFLI